MIFRVRMTGKRNTVSIYTRVFGLLALWAILPSYTESKFFLYVRISDNVLLGQSREQSWKVTFTTLLNALEWNDPTEISFLQPKFYQSNKIISRKQELFCILIFLVVNPQCLNDLLTESFTSTIPMWSPGESTDSSNSSHHFISLDLNFFLYSDRNSVLLLF